MTTVDYLANRVRLELGDQPVPFHEEFFADGDDNQYILEHRPIDCETFIMTVDGVPFTDYQLDARHGVLLYGTPPPEGATVMVAGVKYRYFNQEDLNVFVNEAVREHTGNRNDIYGIQVSLDRIPKVEHHLIAIRATILALWALITDASFDIDINAPDGVSIPRSERYRQLMDVLMARQGEYDAMAKALNVGIFRIEVYSLRRVARLTNRLVPLYMTQEYDDARTPTRLYTDISTQGNELPVESVPTITITLRRGEYMVQDIELGRDVSALLKEGELGAEVLRYPDRSYPVPSSPSNCWTPRPASSASA